MSTTHQICLISADTLRLSDLIARHAEANPASEESGDKPKTKEELRNTRLDFFSLKAPDSNTSEGKRSSNEPGSM